MDNLRYSIIYAAIRPEISEQLSLGVIVAVKGNVDIRYSQEKLEALKNLMTDKEQRFVTSVITSLKKNNSIASVEAVNYLQRYSNNMITLSPWQTIDVEPTEESKDWLFRNYVYDSHKI